MALATVRAATPDDVDEIIRIQSNTWTTAYAELLPEAALQRLSGPAARQAWRAAVSAGNGHHVFVATEGSWTVGFCAASGTDQPDPEDPSPDDTRGALAALLVEPRWGRRGHGLRLFEAATAALRSEGAKLGSAWVPERDIASRAFYARRAWESDGVVRVLDAGDRELREIRLVGSLEPPQAVEPDTELPSVWDL
jgi:GNAT superfamily N-acetyltransferase